MQNCLMFLSWYPNSFAGSLVTTLHRSNFYLIRQTKCLPGKILTSVRLVHFRSGCCRDLKINKYSIKILDDLVQYAADADRQPAPTGPDKKKADTIIRLASVFADNRRGAHRYLLQKLAGLRYRDRRGAVTAFPLGKVWQDLNLYILRQLVCLSIVSWSEFL